MAAAISAANWFRGAKVTLVWCVWRCGSDRNERLNTGMCPALNSDLVYIVHGQSSMRLASVLV